MNQSKRVNSQPKQPSGSKPVRDTRPVKDVKPASHKESSSSLTKQEKELLEECLDELYDDYGTYKKTLKPGEELNATYKLFVSVVKKLGLRQPK